MSEGQPSSGNGFRAGAAGELSRDVAVADVRELRSVLAGGVRALLSLPVELEARFRAHFRDHAARLLRRSIFGLAALYLLVVMPVALVADGLASSAWMYFAVLPIGMVLLAILLVSRIRRLDAYVEVTLGVGVFACLAGTIYCTMLLDNALLGQVAAFETIYVLFIAFSMLRLSTVVVLRSALLAFLLALTCAWWQEVAPSWLYALLYFFVPLMICAINGYMLEYAARRDFIQQLCSSQERQLLISDLQALEAEGDDIQKLLHFSLGRICTHMGWISGRASQLLSQGNVEMVAHYPRTEHQHEWHRLIQKQWPQEQVSALARQTMLSGRASKRQEMIALDQQQVHEITHLVFPVSNEHGVLAVLEFFSVRAESVDKHLRALMEQVGQQLLRMFEREAQQAQMQNLASHDALTGLANRAHLLSHVQKAVTMQHEDLRKRFALLFLDVDRFKWVNDSLGHVAGDQFLSGFAARLREAVPQNVIIARVGGDEFAMLLDPIDDIDDVIRTVHRIQQQLAVPEIIENQRIEMAATIGIALSSDSYTQAEEMLRDADTAMSHAKAQKRGGYSVFVEHMHERVRHRLKLTTDLREAIDLDQLVLHYQPIVCLKTGRLSGFEALVRWPHAQEGWLMPDSFIPLAEETGLVTPMTRLLINKAAKQLASWRQLYPNASDMSVSVNVSADYFADEEMPDEVLKVVRQAGLTPDSLRLEITETQIIENAEACMRNIQKLREAGVRVYIDDFGTGYSSLNYLTSFRVNALKIDRSFMHKLPNDGDETVVVRTISSLGQSLGMDVIAEGVESIEQLRKLQQFGCQYVQGFLISRPLAVEAAAKLIDLRLIDHSALLLVPGDISCVKP